MPEWLQETRYTVIYVDDTFVIFQTKLWKHRKKSKYSILRGRSTQIAQMLGCYKWALQIIQNANTHSFEI